MYVCVQLLRSCPTLCDPWTVARQTPMCMGFCQQDTGVGSHAPLQGIFLTQGSNVHLLHWRQVLYQLSHQGAPVTVITLYDRISHISLELTFPSPLLWL